MHPAVFYEGFAAYVACGDDAYDVNALRIGFKGIRAIDRPAVFRADLHAHAVQKLDVRFMADHAEYEVVGDGPVLSGHMKNDLRRTDFFGGRIHEDCYRPFFDPVLQVREYPVFYACKLAATIGHGHTRASAIERQGCFYRRALGHPG